MVSVTAVRYVVICSSCLHRRPYLNRWEADVDAAAHRRDNPTHSVTVVEERQGEARGWRP